MLVKKPFNHLTFVTHIFDSFDVDKQLLLNLVDLPAQLRLIAFNRGPRARVSGRRGPAISKTGRDRPPLGRVNQQPGLGSGRLLFGGGGFGCILLQ